MTNMINTCLTHVFLFCFLLTIIPGQCVDEPNCCVVCSCTFDSKLNGTRVSCNDKGLASIPSNIPLDVVGFDFSNNTLDIVRNHSFTGLESLLYLNLHMNKIVRLEEGAFTGLNKLLVLRLSQNYLLMDYIYYPEFVFVPLSKLQELYIEDNFNKLNGDYADKIFKPLRELEVLQIDTFSNPTFGEGFAHLVNLRVLRIGGTVIRCTLHFLKNQTLQAFHTAPLEELSIPFCFLEVLEAGSFQFFPHLSRLIIFGNMVGVKNVLRSLSVFRGTNMSEINISGVRVSSHRTTILQDEDSILMHDVIQYLANICVQKIDLSQNRLLFIDLKTLADKNFPFGRCIQYIDMSSNRLDMNGIMTVVYFHYLSNLQFLNMSQQFETHDDMPHVSHALTTFYLMDNYSNLSPPGLWNTKQQEIKITIYLPPKLKYLYISNQGPDMGEITRKFIFNASLLRELDISYNGLHTFIATVEGVGGLEKLDMSRNDMTVIYEHWFDPFTNLQDLNLNDMSLQNDFFFWHGRRLFKPLVKLRSLHLAHNNLAVLSHDIFVDNIYLKILDLSFNRLQTLPLQVIHLDALTSVYMRFNSISYITNDVRTALDMKVETNISIYLEGNMFACVCESLDFITWLHETKIILDNKGNYSCISEHGLITTTSALMKNMDLFWRTCVGKFWLFFAVCTLTLLLATFLSVMLIIRLKTRLIHWMFNILGRTIKIPKRGDFDYDLFVVHADAEYQWPCHTMVSNLEENPERTIRLCLKDRNILPGASTAESIVECIYSSWKSVIILTPAFVADEWCIFAMRTAIYSISNLIPNRVIVLWEEGMTVQQVPEDLVSVLDERSIIQFSWQTDRNERFWQDLYTLIIE